MHHTCLSLSRAEMAGSPDGEYSIHRRSFPRSGPGILAMHVDQKHLPADVIFRAVSSQIRFPYPSAFGRGVRERSYL